MTNEAPSAGLRHCRREEFILAIRFAELSLLRDDRMNDISMTNFCCAVMKGVALSPELFYGGGVHTVKYQGGRVIDKNYLTVRFA